MKGFLCVVLLAAMATLGAGAPVGSDARAKELIRELKLQVLPKESGYLGIVGRSAQIVTVDGKPLAVQSQNYYMLTRDRPINYLHRLVPDDTHILIEGGPVDYFIFHPAGRPHREDHAGDESGRGRAPDHRGARRLLESAAPAPRSCIRADGQRALARIHAGPREDRRGHRMGETLRRVRAVGDSRNAARIDRPELGFRSLARTSAA